MYALTTALFLLTALVVADQIPLYPHRFVARPKFTPLRPPAVPLAVRSPYLSTWVSTHTKETLNGQNPIFWTGAEVGWSGLIQVDDTTYEWLGYPSSALPNIESAITESVKYTATKTVYTISAGKVGVNVTFLTPITLSDLKRQSLPASYLSLSFWSLDKKNHSVNLYTDIDGHWLSGDPNSRIQWSIGLNSKKSSGEENVISHIIEKETHGKLSEWSDKAEWGQLFWSTAMEPRVRYKVASTDDARAEFIESGDLADSVDTQYRSINDRTPVFAFSHHIGNVSKHNSSQDVLFTIGYVQDPIVKFASPSGIKEYLPLWKSYFPTALEMIYFHYQDYAHCVNVSAKLDSQIERDAYRVSRNENYGAIVALSARQAIGGIVFAESAHGRITEGKGSRPLVFLKEISSDGNMQTVDVIFPAYIPSFNEIKSSMPIYLYLEPEILGLLLEPLFWHQEAGLYPNKYSIHDLGSSFPNATGHPEGNDEYMPVEECGNMIFMTLAFSQFSDNVEYLEKHYKILKQWTSYLIDFGLIPATQGNTTDVRGVIIVSTDDFAGPLANQTNLALKAILGIRAMGEIASLTKNDKDAKEFMKTSEDYMQKWEKYTFEENSTHAKLAYQMNSSWGILPELSSLTRGSLYNAYADDLLGLRLFPDHVRSKQDLWYYKRTEKYGLPLDSRHTYTKSDWEMFIAAISKTQTKNLLIDRLALWINETSTDRPFTDLYDTVGTGGFPGITFINRPVIGGHFALLALEKAKELRKGKNMLTGIGQLPFHWIG